MKDMCCDCGADLRKEPGVPGELAEATTATVPVVHNIQELWVSVEEAERLAKQDEKQLLKSRKLVLVVDLDMTLIHTTVQPAAKVQDVYSFTLPNHQYEYHTKLRPNAHKFLESISKYYELHIFTMGSRMYAHTIAKMLDPDGKHFAHRIRSRDEFINSFSKFHDLKALFPCGDHMVCIIDDREDVWNFAPNLIMVKPYKYFSGTDDVNDPFKANKDNKEGKTTTNGTTTTNEENATKDDDNKEKTKNGNTSDEEEKKVEDGESKTEEAKDNDTTAKTTTNNNNHIKDTDDYLTYLGEILERIHKAFYETIDAVKEKGGVAKKDGEVTRFCSFGTLNPDVRVIAPQLRRQTLTDCNLVFTGVIPTNVPPEKSRPWRTAISLGARVSNDVIEAKNESEIELHTTHVVAARHGTQKAYKASKNPNQIKLVNPNWLWAANERWKRPDEADFIVPAYDKPSPSGSRQGTPQHNSFEKSRNKISPLAQEGFELPGGYNPENFLGSFSKNEIDAMDKEVEDFMHSEDEGSSDEEMVRSLSRDESSDDEKNKMKSLDVTLEEETSQSKKKNKKKEKRSSPPSSGQKRKRKQSSTMKKKLKTSEDDKKDNDHGKDSSSSSSSDDDDSDDSSDSSDDGNSSSSTSSNSSASSSSSSDSSVADDDDDQLGSLLERRISESQTE
ncbi:RNA polymerase II subunit A C-terminal domain phosphatase-like isoform X2 [Clytia hemisphaerica]